MLRRKDTLVRCGRGTKAVYHHGESSTGFSVGKHNLRFNGAKNVQRLECFIAGVVPMDILAMNLPERDAKYRKAVKRE